MPMCEAIGREPSTLRRSYTMFDAQARLQRRRHQLLRVPGEFIDRVSRLTELGISDIGLYYPLDPAQLTAFEAIATEVLPGLRSATAITPMPSLRGPSQTTLRILMQGVEKRLSGYRLTEKAALGGCRAWRRSPGSSPRPSGPRVAWVATNSCPVPLNASRGVDEEQPRRDRAQIRHAVEDAARDEDHRACPGPDSAIADVHGEFALQDIEGLVGVRVVVWRRTEPKPVGQRTHPR